MKPSWANYYNNNSRIKPEEAPIYLCLVLFCLLWHVSLEVGPLTVLSARHPPCQLGAEKRLGIVGRLRRLLRH